MKLDYCLSCVQNQNRRPKTINYVEENTGTKFMNFGLREDFIQFDLNGKGSKGKNK